MIRRHGATFRAALMIADLVSAVALFVVLATLRFGGSEWEAIFRRAVGAPLLGAPWLGAPWLGAPWLVVITYAAAWVLFLWLGGLYRVRARWSLRREAADIGTTAILLAVATFAILYLANLADVSRLFLLVLFPSQAALTLASRFILRKVFEWDRARSGNGRFVLIVGAGRAGQEFADRIEAHPALGLRVVGHLSVPNGEPFQSSRPVLGTVDDVVDVLHTNVVDEVAICLPAARWSLVEPVTQVCEAEGKIVRIPMDAVWLPLGRGIVEDFEGRPVVSFVHGPDRAVALVVKRTVDLILASTALVLLSPVLLLVAAYIRAIDGSPVIFRQTRVGLHGRTFSLLKFRTMVRDAEARRAELEDLNEIQGGAFKVTEDPRLIPTGRSLRRASLDELPQLWNVVRGEMSLVGPRPPLPDEVAAYDLWHRRRLSMKPGVTGLWQVDGRGDPVFDRWVEMDLQYIDRWSLWLDLVILLRTIPALITNPGR